jgi:two-component system, OmpR family, response regulator AdeR
MDNALILIAEDEPKIAEVLAAYLARDGFRTICAADGQTALDHHLSLRPDLILLDAKLPKRDGFEVLAEVRRRGDTPIIMVTALKDDVDKLTALRIGADDYVVKPFNTAEVLARVKTVLRRSRDRSSLKMLRSRSIELDQENHAARVVAGDRAQVLSLTLTEFRILKHMMMQPARVYARSELVDACLPEGDATNRTVDSHVSNLRRKIVAASGGACLEPVRGVGYRLDPLQ